MNAARRQTHRGRFHADRRGAVTVEFALTASILFLFLFAALEFSRYNMIQQTANNAAFEAARQCILPGAAASDGQTAGLNVLTAAQITGGAVAINPSTLSLTTSTVTATVTVPVASNLWVTPLFTGKGTVTKACTLTVDWTDSAR
jgi:Flp pilus assembly protein TadG